VERHARPSRRVVLLGTAGIAAGIAVGGLGTHRLQRPSPSRDPIPPSPSSRELRASTFGAVGDGVADDGPALRRALSAASAAGPGTTLRLEGEYRVLGQPDAKYALPLSGARGLRIAGDHAAVIVGDPALGGFSLSDCVDCRIEGIAIDYNPLPFTQTIIRSFDPASRTFDVTVFPGYPLLDAPTFLYAPVVGPPGPPFGAIFDMTTGLLKAGVIDYLNLTAARRIGTRSFRLQALHDLPAAMSAGDVFVYLARQFGHALACFRSPRTNIRQVQVRAANAVAFALVQSDAAHIEACSVGADPGSGRLVSSNGDGVHAQGCRIGPTVQDCTFADMMDDGFNVYAKPLTVRAIPSDTAVVVAGSGMVRAGDRLEFSDSVSGRITGVRTVARLAPTGTNTDLRLELENPLPGLSSSGRDGIADTAFNLSASGEGYLIRRNRYQRHRGHAMRLHAGRGIVEGNEISQTSREGISISNDPDGLEGPHPRDLVIQGNTFRATGGDAAISVEGRKLGYHLADAATQRQLRIENNTVRDWRGCAIAVGAAEDVTLHDNLLIVDVGAGTSARRGIRLERANQVDIDGLVIRSGVPNTPAVAIEVAPSVASGQAGVRISNVQVPSGVVPIQDFRATVQRAAQSR
jgi:hypothetical protein